MQNWLLQNLSDVLNQEVQQEFADTASASSDAPKLAEESKGQAYYSEKKRLAEAKAHREWTGAIAAIEKLLLSEISNEPKTSISGKQGLIFSAPVPLLSNRDLVKSFQSAVFTADAFSTHTLMPCRHSQESDRSVAPEVSSIIKLPLIRQDPISQEQFCLVLTANFGLIAVLGEDTQGTAKFHFSFDPTTIGEAWGTLRSRLVITNYCYLEQLDNLIENFAPQNPDYRLVSNFSRQLLQHIPESTTPCSRPSRDG